MGNSAEHTWGFSASAITVPLATALGQSGTPGEAAGFGLLDAGTARDLLAAAGRSPH